MTPAEVALTVNDEAKVLLKNNQTINIEPRIRTRGITNFRGRVFRHWVSPILGVGACALTVVSPFEYLMKNTAGYAFGSVSAAGAVALAIAVCAVERLALQRDIAQNHKQFGENAERIDGENDELRDNVTNLTKIISDRRAGKQVDQLKLEQARKFFAEAHTSLQDVVSSLVDVKDGLEPAKAELAKIIDIVNEVKEAHAGHADEVKEVEKIVGEHLADLQREGSKLVQASEDINDQLDEASELPEQIEAATSSLKEILTSFKEARDLLKSKKEEESTGEEDGANHSACQAKISKLEALLATYEEPLMLLEDILNDQDLSIRVGQLMDKKLAAFTGSE